MLQNKNKRKVKTKVSPAVEDTLLLKKLPRLLALCEFALLPFFLVVSPVFLTEQNEPVKTSLDTIGAQGVVSESSHQITERSLSAAIPNEVHIATATEAAVPPKAVMSVTVTAYSSTEDQTDSTPFHTANGHEVRDGIVAANFLPLGTNLRIPDVFGDKIFTVLDRMHERFDQRIDIWMPTREAAQEFGIRHLKIEILPL